MIAIDFQGGAHGNFLEFVCNIVAEWAQLVYNQWEHIVELHQEFLQRQPYKDSKKKCDDIVDQIIKGHAAPAVTLLEESYINAMLTKQGYERRY